MSFLIFSVKNAFRGKLRFILTLILLVIGISALSSSIGLFYLSEDLLQIPGNDNGGADFNIYSNNTFSLEELNKIQSTKGVKEAVGASMYRVTEYNDTLSDAIYYAIYLVGFSGKSLVNDSRIPGLGRIKVIDGRLPVEGSHEILISADYAKGRDMQVGKNLTLTGIQNLSGVKQTREKNQGGVGSDDYMDFKTVQVNFTVVGIINPLYSGEKAQKFPTPSPDGIVSLDVANELVYNSSTSKFDFIYVNADPNQINQIKSDLMKYNPYYIIWDDHDYISEINTIFMYAVMFFLAIGVLIVIITTLRSISERTREIGVLKAIGWSNKRVMTMILIETTTLTLIAWIIALTILLTFMAIQSGMGLLNFFETNIGTIMYFLIITLILSLLMPIIGSVIPIIRVTRLKPTEALQYE